jgi:hypothetical protein
MSITRSYNKHTGTYYAYETSYEWDESLKKKVQRKRCIGQFDPVTDEIIPNKKRGRPRKGVESTGNESSAPVLSSGQEPSSSQSLTEIIEKMSLIEKTYQSLGNELSALVDMINDLKA